MVPFIFILYSLSSIYLISFTNPKYHNRFYIFLGIILIFTAGLRPDDIDQDYQNYLDSYYYPSFSRAEPTFLIISHVVKVCFGDPLYLFLIYASLGVIIKFTAFKELSNLYLLSGVIYLCNFFILHEMTQIRVGIAAAILLLCIKPIYDRNLKKFIVLVAISISFHYTSLMFLPLWFLKPKKINKYFYLFIPIAYILAIKDFRIGYLIKYITIEEIQILYQLYSSKVMDDTELNIFNLLILIRCLIGFILLYNIDKLTKINKYAILLLKIYILSIIIFILFSDLPVLSFRGSELYGIVEVILIPFLFYVFYRGKTSIFIPLTLGFLLLYMSLFINKILIINT